MSAPAARRGVGPGVAVPGVLGAPGGRREPLPADCHVGDVADAAARLGLRVVFVPGPFGVELCGRDAVRIDKQTGEVGAYAVTSEKGGSRFRVEPSGGGESVGIVPLVLDPDGRAGPWAGFGDPQDLVACFGVWSRLVGTDWRCSTAETAEDLLLDCSRRGANAFVFRDEPALIAGRVGIELEAGGARVESACNWIADAGRVGSAAGLWVHGFDLNAQHLSAWSTTLLGAGACELVTRPEFDAKRAGFWRFGDALEEWDADTFGGLLPGIHTPSSGWAHTATVRRLAEQYGDDLPRPAEAVLWEYSGEFLSGAGRKLADARSHAIAEAHDARSALRFATRPDLLGQHLHRAAVFDGVVDAVKEVYTVASGRFKYAGSPAPFYRPDWWAAILATSRVNLHRKLAKVYETAGKAPLAIATDAALYVSEEPSAGRFAEQCGLAIGRGLGQWKILGSAPAEPVVAAHGSGFAAVFEAFKMNRETS